MFPFVNAEYLNTFI